MLDNCQHVLLGCCYEVIDFLQEIGTLDKVTFHDKLNVIDDSRRLVLKSSPLPAPLHLVPALMRGDFLSNSEKRALMRLAVLMPIKKPAKIQTAAAYFASLGCPKSLVTKLIEPVVVSALNEFPSEASADYARMVLLEMLLKNRRAYRLGVPDVALSELISNPALHKLQEMGCEVRLGAPIRAIHSQDGRMKCLETASGERVEYDACVAAVLPQSLSKIGIDATGAEQLTWRPIISAHLFFGRMIKTFEPACVVEEPFGWVFGKRFETGYVQAIASAADGIVGLGRDEIVALAVRAASQAEPVLASIPLQRSIIYKERHATFATLACEERRPPVTTSLDNVFVAGDWVATGWPATIESAVRSGRAAAEAVADAINRLHP